VSIWVTEVEADGDGAGPTLAVKDIFDTAGVRTTYGSAIFRDHVPSATAGSVARLLDAGYVMVGKANLHEFAWGITSENDHYGWVPNPAAPGRVAGGSSGGSAAALAAGLVDAALGSDSGGSIRIPAACCGVVGLKVSFGAVPMDGCWPLAPSYDTAGPMARDVAGCERMMEALAPGFTRAETALEDLRVGVAWTEFADPLVAARVHEAAALFPSARPVDLPLPDGVYTGFAREVVEVHAQLFAEHEDLYGPSVAFKMRNALKITDAAAEAGLRARDLYRERVASLMEELDLIVAPTVPMVAPPAGVGDLELRGRMLSLTFAWNALGAPALALPCGPAEDGLPASVQLLGRPGEDALGLAAGRLLESSLRH
jgi:Asp-tRNA(Asn)/Glu-tRNA(Gln) amidotransferase A subunit family amidase